MNSMDNMEKYVVAMMGVVFLAGVVQVLIPQATYCCPICTNVCFNTYDELYAHFTTEHPTEPIDIIWE